MMIVLTSGAHSSEPDDNGLSIGFLINEYAGNFGLGAQVTSPFIFDILALRLTGSVQFSAEGNWEPWGMLQAGIVGASKIVSDFARFYGEGGVVLAFPGTALSTESTSDSGDTRSGKINNRLKSRPIPIDDCSDIGAF